VIAARPTAVSRIPGGPWEQSCYVVAAESGDAVVIDPGGEPEQVRARVEADRLTVHAVLATHGHHDHLGALAELVDAYDVPFGIHSAEAKVLRRVNFHRFVLHKLGPIAIPAIGLDLASATTLRFGDLEVGVVHTPGHTPGSVCFEIGGELFTGDTLMATRPGPTDMRGSDGDALAASIAMLRERYPPTIRLRPGHGEPGTLGEAVAGSATAGERAP
jgi:glyoxylase-like metal-dependent hydrolase (beta-lactamase superfamily II)